MFEQYIEGKSVPVMTQNVDLPGMSTVYRWIRRVTKNVDKIKEKVTRWLTDQFYTWDAARMKREKAVLCRHTSPLKAH